jgi:hypothetical protein
MSSPGCQNRWNEAGCAYNAHNDMHLNGVGTSVGDEIDKALIYFIEQYAEILRVLKAEPDGIGGNMLDHCAILGTSDMFNGWQEAHSHENFPLLIAGRAGGALKYPGVHLRASGVATQGPLTILRAVGAPLTEWGWGRGDNLKATTTFSGIEA